MVNECYNSKLREAEGDNKQDRCCVLILGSYQHHRGQSRSIVNLPSGLTQHGTRSKLPLGFQSHAELAMSQRLIAQRKTPSGYQYVQTSKEVFFCELTNDVNTNHDSIPKDLKT
jgi:hypothetical protein